VVEWSWDLLTPAERLLAERFAVFPAGATPDAVAAVCAERGGDGEIDPADIDDLLSSLVDKSLLQGVQEEDQTRLRMLETVREYGTERLAERAELAELLGRHARYYSRLTAAAVPRLTTQDQVAWLPGIKAERNNIFAALRYWCDVRAGDEALTLAIALSGLAMVLGEGDAEMSDWLGQALTAADGRQVDQDLQTVAEVMYRVSRHMRAAGEQLLTS
jgi:predicted ATPase